MSDSSDKSSSSNSSREKLSNTVTLTKNKVKVVNQVKEDREQVETMLSWNDEQQVQPETKTQSKMFQFANSAIFELDS